ncbi:MAG: 2-oxoacid:acceptor oxidoreductase subunit alpha [Candidatus Kerfeldbacteria bacterium]|nr:2-oxoacid:acceptor oxidoreductase subunit alpha [Candidatus Kerfeldbacteria bacterium]
MERQKNTFSWKIGGEAGFGIMASGTIFAKTCLRAGLQIFDYSEYPSLIRGGHNTYQVYVAPQPVRAWRAAVNILVALNRETVDQHLAEVSPGGAVVFDPGEYSFRDFRPAALGRDDIRWHPVSLGQISVDHGGELYMRNTVALGATFALLSVNFSFPAAVVKDLFMAKGQAVVDLNLALLRAGYQAIDSEAARHFPWDLDPLPSPEPPLYLAGNEAIALGALQAGCKFYAAYPMTPSSTILHFLAEHGPTYGMVVRHAEDEIGVINETIGAAYAGVRAMCGTAGGGFSLMTEAVGLAGMTEVGVVIIEAQRGGPSTGLPTWTEQADLRQVLHASQGDFLKIVLAPGDVEECFELTQLAFDLAERYQTPIIIMTDKYLAESHVGVPRFRTVLPVDRGLVRRSEELPPGDRFRRYDPAADGVAPRTLPGTPGGLFVANSDEHDRYGFSEEGVANRLAQMNRRARKEAMVLRGLPHPTLVGPAKADLTIVSWGSTKGVVSEARAILTQRYHLQTNHLHLWLVNPFPATAVDTLLSRARTTVMVEGNQSGQMAGWIRQHTGRQFDHHLRQYDGRPFEPEKLAGQLQALIR